jgi:hypothetical protein
MHHKRGRPLAARAGCALCHPWKVSGAHAAKHRTVAARRVDFATVEQVEEWWHTRHDDEWVPDYGEPDDGWMLDWHRPKENPWQVPPLHIVRAQMHFRQQTRAEYQREPASPPWALMAHAFTRRSP